MIAPSSWSVATALLSLASFATAQNVITNDLYFYGQSPPVYPSPAGAGSGDWAAAYAKASALVAQMTIEEKANFTVGVSGENGCSGNIPANPRLGFPGLCLNDAGNGVRATDGVNAWASGIHAGASWNKELTYQRGRGMGGEFLAKGVNIALGPVIGPLGRIAEGGRNWEGFSSDPYLAGALAAQSIQGVQERGVMASAKHFIGYEQETNRNPGLGVESVSSNIDDKTMHEVYLWPFVDAVHAGTAIIMCSYNRINNSYACGNSKTLNGLLKTELGFQGFVVSDWSAQHSGLSTAEAGLDMAMPNSAFWGSGLLVESIQNGSLPESRLDDMVTRILAGWYKLDQNSTISEPGVGMPIDPTASHKVVNARDPASQPILFQAAVEGHVLVKNEGALPLKRPEMISVFGYDAKASDTMNIGLAWQFGDFDVSLSSGEVLGLLGGVGNVSQIAGGGTLIGGGGSGANSPPYISSPFDALSERAYQDNSLLFWDFNDTAPEVNGASDACLVFINAFATEGLDRTGLHDDYSDALVNTIANSCANTIVVIHHAGVRLVDQFIDHPNVTALIFAHLPGQDSGRALVSLLYGDSNPSGKLPYTVPKNESDYGYLVSPSLPASNYINFPQSNFSEGVFIDYKHFDAYNITPRYEFGFGLSYTTFSYANLKVRQATTNTQPYPAGPLIEGGQADLWDVLFQVTADITNSGNVTGQEVVQLYVGIPGGPAKQLRGFEKVAIDPGQTVTVDFDLMRRDLSEWDVVVQAWNLQKGEYNVWVGQSVLKLPLVGSLTV